MKKYIIGRKSVKGVNVEFKIENESQLKKLDAIVDDIMYKQNNVEYFTKVRGKETKVEVKNTGKTDNKYYLYSSPDSASSNNIDELDQY